MLLFTITFVSVLFKSKCYCTSSMQLAGNNYSFKKHGKLINVDVNFDRRYCSNLGNLKQVHYIWPL